jgi:hypothetical protein
MVSLVVQALESVAEDADDRGDQQSALNATYLACSIRGCGLEASTDRLRAAELLLEQGISYVASVSERLEERESVADVEAQGASQGSYDHQSRVLH